MNNYSTHTQNGIALLRIISGLFFLIPGIINALQPQDFQVLVDRLPSFFEGIAPSIQPVVTFIEITGGALLLMGWYTRLTTIPLAFMTLGIGLLVASVDEASKLQTLSLMAHIAGIGVYASLIFLGSGSWSVGKKKSFFAKVAKIDGNFIQRFAHDAVVDSGKNFGIGLLRLSIGLFFIGVSFLSLIGDEYAKALSDNIWITSGIAFLCFVGGGAILSGFKMAFMGWVLVGLTLLHFIFVGFEEAWVSQVGLINVMLHVLIIGSLLSLRIIRFGTGLEAEHILSLDKKTVVVIGGGFAGTTLVKNLERKIPDDWQAVLISEENYTTFNPMLAEIVGGAIMPSHVIAPIRRMVKRTRFINGRVDKIDFQKKNIQISGNGALNDVPYNHLVFALGSRANPECVPGMAENSLPFKLLGDALVLRNRVIERLEAAEQEEDIQKRQWLGHFVVIGGGFSGIEVAGSIQDFIQSSAKHYPRLSEGDLKVTVVHGTDLPLPELGGGKLGEHTRDSMRKRGVDIILNARVQGADARGVLLGDDERIDGGTVVCTIGTKPNPLIHTITEIEIDKGRIAVNADMSAKGTENIWALGDCAFVPNDMDGRLAPPTAQFAVQEGMQLAHNINCKIRGGTTRPFSYKSRGSMATIGHLNGVADLGFVKITGLPAWLLWRAFYLSLMPTMVKKTKMFFEWTWSMLFSADIVNLRFTTSPLVDKDIVEENEKNI